ncbi:hypothetical protein NPIL_290611 [Nephila pilipes]|uniref:Uncharacterized protein n=1 Tax=Nephila pilipes TaxID=299642 RepID=A0A8X6QRT8_NEPPI|nr:hypothetical protein NPIL_290611 [Nephila pilipes]
MVGQSFTCTSRAKAINPLDHLLITCIRKRMGRGGLSSPNQRTTRRVDGKTTVSIGQVPHCSPADEGQCVQMVKKPIWTDLKLQKRNKNLQQVHRVQTATIVKPWLYNPHLPASNLWCVILPSNNQSSHKRPPLVFATNGLYYGNPKQNNSIGVLNLRRLSPRRRGSDKFFFEKKKGIAPPVANSIERVTG